MIRTLPSTKYLKECFWYQPKTGLLFWRKRPSRHFKSSLICCGWNKRFAGTPALNSSGRYRHGHLDHKYCVAHRVIWKLATGKEPPPILDHKDQNKRNNRWGNLRAATKEQNCINRRMSKFNSSGCVGVHKHRNKGKWVAQLGTVRKKRYVGIFDSREKAMLARRQAAVEHYGEFVP